MSTRSRIVRASKFRHVYGEDAKPEKALLDLPVTSAAGDHRYISASAKFFAVALSGGGGPVGVFPLDYCGKYTNDTPKIEGHTSGCTDTAFSPFNDNLLATGSSDATVKLWQIPEGGLTETLREPAADLVGHNKPISFIEWNPVANNVLAVATRVPEVRLWDVNTGKEALKFSSPSMIQDMSWNYNGSILSLSGKDKKIRLVDPRKADTVIAVSTLYLFYQTL